jgi:hypothetical protein
MLSLFLIILSGVVVGYALRRVPQMRYTGVVISVVIVLLLFLLGTSVGANEEVLNNFPVIGFDAFVLAAGAISGTLLCAWWVYKCFFKSK